MTKIIGIAGDWHGNQDWSVARLNDFAAADITTILHLGDFGIWHDEAGIDFISAVNETLSINKQTIFVTLGNHENYDMVSNLTTLSEGEFAGWMVDPKNPNILYATRGQRWIWEGVSFVSLGGANSIDRFTRTENLSWWAGEQISYADVMRTIDGGYADIFLAHDCPAGVELFGSHRTSGGWNEDALTYAAASRNDLRAAVDEVKPEILFHGHYHHNLDLTTTLEDYAGDSYDLRTVCMNKDDADGNIGILELPSKKFTRL